VWTDYEISICYGTTTAMIVVKTQTFVTTYIAISSHNVKVVEKTGVEPVSCSR
jgi:hypothetical protein